MKDTADNMVVIFTQKSIVKVSNTSPLDVVSEENKERKQHSNNLVVIFNGENPCQVLL